MKLRILLVDDDLTNSMLLRRFLEAEGFAVTYANNGAVGMQLYEAEHPDLILLDINMPEMNGFEMAEAVRKNDRKVIIFFLTDRTEKNDRLKGFSLKGNDYIAKPFYPEELVAKINERFSSRTVESDEEYRIGDTLFSPKLSSLTYRGVSHQLSVRQAEIMLLLAADAGAIVDRDDILERVWGDASYANSLALNVQISYLRRLLDDPALSITSVKKRGYMLSVR